MGANILVVREQYRGHFLHHPQTCGRRNPLGAQRLVGEDQVRQDDAGRQGKH